VSACRLYLLISFVGAFAANTAFTLNLVYQSQVVGLDPWQLILVGTVLELVCFVAQVPTGVIAVLVANAVWAVGAVCVDGVVLAGVDLAVPIMVAAGVILALGVRLAVVMPERGWAPAVSGDRTTLGSVRAQLATAGGVVRRSRTIGYVLVGSLFLGLSSKGFDRLSQPRFVTELTLPSTPAPQWWLGAFAVVAAAGSVVLTGLVAALLRHAAAPALNVWLVANSSSATRATVFSIQSQVDALGQIVGGPPAGWLGRRASMGGGHRGLRRVPGAGGALLRVRRPPAGSGGHPGRPGRSSRRAEPGDGDRHRRTGVRAAVPALSRRRGCRGGGRGRARTCG
jgi:DHA3 family tetracycline resistance protein-like MFS transporter